MPSGVYDHCKLRGRVKVPREIRTCACGECGETFECLVTSEQRFIYGHYGRVELSSRKGKTYEEIYGEEKAAEVKGKIGESSAGRELPEEAKQKIGLAHKNKPKSKEHRAKLHISLKKYHREYPNAQKECHNTPVARRNRSAASIEIMSRPEVKVKHRAALIEANSHPEAIANHCAAQKRNWQNPDYVAKMLKSRKMLPNKPEKFLTELLQKLFPGQWKYVGNGSFWITSNGKHLNPDFISTDGQKKIIEHFGVYFHGEKKTGIPNEQHEQERIGLFAQHGYQTLIIWEHELKDKEILKDKLVKFILQRG